MDLSRKSDTGLIRTFFVVSFFLLRASLFAAQNDEKSEPLKVLLSVDQDQVRENSPFLLVMQVNHADPLEVKLTPPDFGGNYTLDMLRSTMYIRNGSGDDAEKWTELELFITPKAAGKLHIDPFTVSTPGQLFWTQPVELNVLPEEKSGTPALLWGGVKSIQQGASGEVYLRITGTWTASESLPVNIAAPRNAIVEPLNLTGDDKYSGIVFRIRVTPLDEKAVDLGPVKFNYEKWTLTVPALSLRVLKSVKKTASRPAGTIDYPAELAASFLQTGRQEARAGNKKTPFPPEAAGKKRLGAFLSGAYFTGAAEAAAKFWDEGNYAAALAALRKGERDSIAGIEFAALRKQCEKALGIPVMVNENWRPSALFWAFIALSLLFIIARLVIFFVKAGRVKIDGSLKPRLPRLEIAIAALIFILCAVLLAGKKIDAGTRAIARTSFYYNVPEISGPQAGSFELGTPLRITTKSGVWLYATSEDGTGGWLPRQEIVLY
jgi:hypothetical protein